MKYFIYCRKSSEGDERQALSLPRQERETSELAIKENLFVVKTFSESKSARIPEKRTIFKEMLSLIRTGNADGIICWHLNRLSRNWKEAGELMQMLTDGVIKEIVTPEKRITADNSNDILLGVEFGSSSQFSKDLSKVIKGGIREKIIRGQYPHSAPHFYTNTGSNKFNKNIEPDEKLSPFFEQWVDWIIDSKPSIRSCAKWLTDRNLTTNKGKLFASSTVHQILKNPVYCGILKYSEFEETKGTWRPLISESKYRKLQETMGIKRKPQFYSHSQGYKGLFLCGNCGCSITCSHKIKKSGKSYIYYHCTKKRGACSQPYITEAELENQIFHHISKIKIDQEILNLCIDLAKEKHSDEYIKFDKSRKELSNKISEIDEMLKELFQMRLKRLIGQEDFENNRGELESKRLNLISLTTDKDFNHEIWLSNLEAFFETCFKVENIFNNATITERNQLVRVFGKNLTLHNGVIGWNFRKPWNEILLVENDETCPAWWSLVDKVGTYLKFNGYYLSKCIPVNINTIGINI